MTLQKAKELFDSLFAEFPFVGDSKYAISVVLAGALTLFCRHLFPGQVIRPNFCALANAEGAGKTLLMKIAMIPILGEAPAGTPPKDEDEMRKLVGATALAATSVLFLDNIKGHLSSPSLEALTTSPVTVLRFLGQSKLVKAEHGLTVFITGNQATFSPDIRRRTLSCELFVKEARPEDRLIKHPLDDAELVVRRSEILSALWALVRTWKTKSCPEPTQLHPSFTAWSKVVGGILEAAGYLSPCRQASSQGGADGDRDLANMEKLVGEMVEGSKYRFTDLVDYAHNLHLFEWIIGDGEGADTLDAKARSTFGRLLSDRFTDRLFANNGKPVRFVQTSKASRKVYEIQPIPEK